MLFFSKGSQFPRRPRILRAFCIAEVGKPKTTAILAIINLFQAKRAAFWKELKRIMKERSIVIGVLNGNPRNNP